MPRRKQLSSTRPFRLLMGTMALCLLTGLMFFVTTSTRAGFEVPSIDTNNFTPTTFNGVAVSMRAGRVPAGNATADDASGQESEYYEGWAVGFDSDHPTETTKNGLIYYFDGGIWKKLNAAGGKYGQHWTALPSFDLPKLNAIGSQYDYASGVSNYWLGSDNGKMFEILGGYPSNGQFTGEWVHQSTVVGAAGRPIYAIGASDGRYAIMLAGGANGYVLMHTGFFNGTNPDTWQPVSTDPGLPADLRQFGAFPSNANETITGIAYPPGSAEGYVVTTSFPDKSGILDRDCPSGVGRVGRLYRVFNNVWTRLQELPNTCFYGLTAGVRNQPIAAGGQLANIIWIAAHNGIWRYDELGGSWTHVTPTDGTKLFAITAIRNQGGDGQNLLLNGDFVAKDPSPVIANLPDYWSIGRGNWMEVAGVCGQNNSDLTVLPSSVNPWDPTHTRGALVIQPGARYDNEADCNAPTETNQKYTEFVRQYVPQTAIEGAQYRISGNYQVEWNPSVPDSGPGSSPYRQGGISLGCAGSYYPDTSVDCPYSTTRETQTLTTSNKTTVTKSFSFVISRQDTAFNKSIAGGAIARPLATSNGQMLEVRCLATYGAKVTCDNLKVEPVNTPSLYNGTAGVRQPWYSYDVIGVGGDSTSAKSFLITNGLDPAATAVTETQPNTARALYSIGQAGSKHVFTVGSESTMLQRSSGNVYGYIWVGEASLGNVSSGVNAAVGWISSNCALSVDANGHTLCQRTPESYGLSLDLGTNALTGRAWFGKNYGFAKMNDDKETINLGTCVKPARNAALDTVAPGKTYMMGQGQQCVGGRCSADTSQPCSSPAQCTGSCNTATRTCYNETNGVKACVRDFDCYGRCSADEGFICLTDADCSYQPVPTGGVTGSRLSSIPSNRLQCDASPNAANACTSAGWLSFNGEDFTALGSDRKAPDGTTTVGGSYNTANDAVSGWGRFMTYANPNDPNTSPGRGWVHLRGNQITLTNSNKSNKLFACRDCAITGTIPTQSMSCKFCRDDQNRFCEPNYSPIAPALSCTFYCNGDPTKTACLNDSDCSATPGVSCKAPLVCANKTSKTCSSDIDCIGAGPGPIKCLEGAFCTNPTIKTATTELNYACYPYGTYFDPQSQKFFGYAWSEDFGWLDMNFLTGGTSRYLQTRLGDIFAKGPIGSATSPILPITNCNATYIISSEQTITNFCSALGPSSVKPSTYFPPFTTAQNVYTNVLGRIDVDGLTKVARTEGTNNFNKYGAQIVHVIATGGNKSITSNSPLNPDRWTGTMPPDADGHPILNGKVYVVDGCTPTCTIDNDLIFGGGSIIGGQITAKGSGTLVVNGNLLIKANMQYGVSGTITDTRQLASLAVFVKGDMTIANNVTNVVGSYFVTKGVTGTGLVKTSDDINSSLNHFQLTIKGLLIANGFEFGRKYAGTVSNPLPSELIIFDGRLQTNAPDGLIDFAHALPNTINAGP